MDTDIWIIKQESSIIASFLGCFLWNFTVLHNLCKSKNKQINNILYSVRSFVSTRRYLDVDSTFFERHRRQMDVKTTLCACWDESRIYFVISNSQFQSQFKKKV